MPNEHISPTPVQQRLVNIGMLIQFHLAAIGHLVGWVLAFRDLQDGYGVEMFVYQGVPISFAILIGFYIIFRFRLAYSSFDAALVFMIVLNIAHALFMGFHGLILTPLFLITPLRLAIPILLYSIALHSYRATKYSIVCDS